MAETITVKIDEDNNVIDISSEGSPIEVHIENASKSPSALGNVIGRYIDEVRKDKANPPETKIRTIATKEQLKEFLK